MTSESLPVQSDSWVTPPIDTQRGHAFSHSLTSSHLSIKRNSVIDPASMDNSGHSVDGVVLDITRRDSKREDADEELRFQRETSFDGPLPSPPLTRTNTKESVTQQYKKTLAGENQDSEASVWHPLQFGDPANHTQDTTVVDLGDSIVDANGRLVFPDGMSKNSPPPSPRGSVHPIDTQKPHSPQPWELVDPPPSNGHKPSQYRTVSNKFSTLQGSSHRRPLIPKSSYYFGPPPPDAAFGTPPMGQIGVHHPREVIRIERDYTGGELIQFAPIYPLELEGRITPTQFLESINAINELLISAHSIRRSMVDNVLAVVTLYLSRLIITSHYEKEMKRLKLLFDELNSGLYNPAGLNLLWPGKVAFLYMEIEYYVRFCQSVYFCETNHVTSDTNPVPPDSSYFYCFLRMHLLDLFTSVFDHHPCFR
ncbi:Golgin subfamily A member 7/ERF4 family-domain-containing protein [Armillaria fumosa]|nr:Golgin subfamily A member 7/ERF4 family-domain-containing protein [Armillaria fumosa]